MVRQFACILVCCFIGFESNAQAYDLHKRYPGYFINAKGDTIRGFILIENKLDNQRGAEYSNDARGEKIIIHLLPHQVKGFKVQDRAYTAVYYGEPDPMNEHFLLTLQEGAINLYQYFRLAKDMYVGSGNGQRPASGDDEMYLQSEFIIMKQGKQYVITGQSSLSKQAKEIFSGNEELLAKIDEKEKDYRYNDLPSIVKEYNEWKAASR